MIRCFTGENGRRIAITASNPEKAKRACTPDADTGLANPARNSSCWG
jgi:hypothetical protein